MIQRQGKQSLVLGSEPGMPNGFCFSLFVVLFLLVLVVVGGWLVASSLHQERSYYTGYRIAFFFPQIHYWCLVFQFFMLTAVRVFTFGNNFIVDGPKNRQYNVFSLSKNLKVYTYFLICRIFYIVCSSLFVFLKITTLTSFDFCFSFSFSLSFVRKFEKKVCKKKKQINTHN